MDPPYLTPGSSVTSQNSTAELRHDMQRGHSVSQVTPPLGTPSSQPNGFQPQIVEPGSENGLARHTVPANLSYASHDPMNTRPLEAPGGALPSQPTEENGQNAAMRGASPRQHEQRLQEKRERDKIRKRNERSKDAQNYARICELLKINPKPHNTLANRILRAVENMVAQKELDEKVRCQLQVAESEVASLSQELAQLQTRTALLVAPAFPSMSTFWVDSATQMGALVSDPSISWSQPNGQGTGPGA